MAHHSTLGAARSLLFVPGNRPDRFAKAARSGADAIVLDLEDAVPPAEKSAARAAVAASLADLASIGTPVVVRVNAVGGADGVQDLDWLAAAGRIDGVMLPKVESREDVELVTGRFPGLPLLPLIESAAGYEALPRIAAGAGVARLVVGHIDFMADTGIQCSRDERELDALRFAVAIATRKNELAPAVDGVTVAIDDDALLREDVLRSVRFGFGAKLCIHPRQIPVVHEQLLPPPDQIAWARRVLAADAGSGGAAVQVDGKMVDAPVVISARRILFRASLQC